jgi:cbb3-type cytochrome oxidase maturation protein
MYYIFWILLIAISLWFSLIGFFWAIRTGQFSDQDRARYLPLVGEDLMAEVRNPSRWSREVYAVAIIMGIGLLVLLFTAGMVLFQNRR